MSPSAATLDAIREAFMDALCEVHADARAVLARVDARRLVRADHRTGGGDVQCAVASALFHALRRSDGYRTDSTTVSCVSAMGIARGARGATCGWRAKPRAVVVENAS